jgi:hypothetical protein
VHVHVLCVQTGSGTHPASYPMGTGGLFPRAKARLGRDADHSPPSIAEAENEYELHLLSPPSAYVACSGTALAFSMFMSGNQNAVRNHNIKVQQILQNCCKILGNDSVSENCIREEVTSVLDAWNARYHSVQNILFSASYVTRSERLNSHRITQFPHAFFVPWHYKCC